MNRLLCCLFAWGLLCAPLPVPAQEKSPAETKPADAKPTDTKPAAGAKDPKTATIVMLGKKAGEERSDNSLMLKLAWCPPGKFTMGSPRDEQGRQADEDQVEVTFTRGFWLGKYEVSQGQWRQVMETEPWRGRQFVKEGAECPATFITWDEVRLFCRKLTETERNGGRLPMTWMYTIPTEAQWEYACRAGGKLRYSFGNDESMLRSYGWFSVSIATPNGDTEQFAHPGGLKKPNAWGLFDMHGNIWEWCRDTYADRLPGGTDPEAQGKNANRMLRGGSWLDDAGNCRSAYRHYSVPGAQNSYLGFRLALVPVSP